MKEKRGKEKIYINRQQNNPHPGRGGGVIARLPQAIAVLSFECT